MIKVDLPNMSKGEWKIEKFTVDRVDFQSLLHGREVPIGETFTRLLRNGNVVMSDTPAEMNDMSYAVYKAFGNVLINGLGLGVFLKNILLHPEVTKVTAIEISQDLIDIIKPYYNDPRVTIICANAFSYKPPKCERYNLVWHDIWDNICGDNVLQMTKLHRKYGKKTDYQDSWCKAECINANKRNY